MFEVFSRSYYLGRLYVTPSPDEQARIQRAVHEQVNEELFTSGEGIERLDSPLLMKLENQHFPVHPGDDVPADTLAVPRELLENTRVENPPTLTEVFLAREEWARQLLGAAGITDGVVGRYDGADT